MPYPNEHAARIREPGRFSPKTFRRTDGGKAVLPGAGLITVPASIKIIWGKLKGADKSSDEPLVQALRFPTKSYTADEAKKWLKNKKVKYISFEKASKSNDLYENSINNNDMKEILLYSPIWDFTAERFIEKINEVPDEEDIMVRLNTPGGSVFAGWSIIGKIQTRKGKVHIAVDGHAASMGFIFAAFGDTVEALDVSRFMIHRASGYVENDEQKEFLASINAELLAKLKKKIDLGKFKEIVGDTLDSVFKAEKVRDVWLTAKQAKEIGLVDKIVRLDPGKLKAYTEKFVAFADFDDISQGSEIEDQDSPHGSEKEPIINKQDVKQKPKKKMTSKELKNSEPEAYSEIHDAGIEAGSKAERDRVKSWLAFIDIDRETVIKAIKDGTEFTQADMAEMTVKATAKKEVDDTETDSAGKVKTDPPDGKTKEEKDIEAFTKEVDDGVDVKNLVQ